MAISLGGRRPSVSTTSLATPSRYDVPRDGVSDGSYL